MAYTIVRSHYLEVNSVPLDTTGWHIRNLEPEIMRRAFRGDSLLLPGATGKRRRRKRLDSVVYSFELVVEGLKKWDGTSYSDASTGFITNLEELESALGFPSVSALSCTWHRTGGSTKTASGDIVGWTPSDLGTKRHGLVVMELQVDAGKFA